MDRAGRQRQSLKDYTLSGLSSVQSDIKTSPYNNYTAAATHLWTYFQGRVNGTGTPQALPISPGSGSANLQNAVAISGDNIFTASEDYCDNVTLGTSYTTVSAVVTGAVGQQIAAGQIGFLLMSRYKDGGGTTFRSREYSSTATQLVIVEKKSDNSLLYIPNRICGAGCLHQCGRPWLSPLTAHTNYGT